MAAKAGVTLDTIVIKIESKAGSANSNLAKLTKTLIDLKAATKGGFRGLNNLAASINEVKKASNGLSKTVESLSGLSNITKMFKNLSTIDKPTGLSNAIKNVSQIPEVFARIDTKTLDNVARVSSTLATALTPLANKMAEIGYGFTKIELLANRYGVSVTKIKEKVRENNKEHEKYDRTLKKIQRTLSQVKNSANSFGKAGLNAFGKLHSKIKQVGLSLLGTRTLFTAVRKAVSEYMQMDEELTKTTQNLWRALGAQLAPAIEFVIYLFTQITRVIYSVIYALTGIDLIARANAKALASMGKAAKDALGNLQKFDDLNTVDFGKGNEIPQIELDKIDLSPIQKVIDWMKKLKEEIKTALSTGDWSVVATTFFGGIADGIDGIPWYKLGQKVRETIEKIPWKEIWDGIVKIAEESFKGLGEFINGLFGQDEDSKFGENFLISLLGIYAVITLIKGATGLGGVLETLGLISKAPSFATITGLFGGILVIVLSIKGVLDTWGEFFENPTWETGWNTFFDTLLGIAGVVGGIALLFGAWPVALIAAITMIVILIGKFLYENLDSINQWAYDTGVAIRKKFTETWEKIKKGWNDMIDAFKNGGIKEGFKWILNNVIIGLLNKAIDKINSKLTLKISDKLAKILEGLGIKITGGTYSLFTIPHIPKLETGTNEIEYEGIYHLHEGEAVVPKKYNPALGNGTDEELGQKLDTLISIMNNMNFTNVVNIGNKTLYKEQQRYNKMQNDKYGTTVNL